MSLLKKGGWLVVFLILAVLVANTTYQFSQKFFASYNVTQMEGQAILVQPTATLAEGAPPPVDSIDDVAVPGPSGPTPQPWDGASRVTVLVMGLDYGDWSDDREGPSRTDTMVLFTVDPLTKTGGVLNIPRDLWVNIPDFGYGRINTAYYLGEAYDLPGGGAALAIRTVELLLGVPINYYAQVDFFAFERLIDAIDGVEIDVPGEIKIDPIGKYNTKILQPGVQRLYGPDALAYARARNTAGGDFDRAQRTQQVIMAIRKRVLKPTFFPVLLSRAPQLYNELAGGVHTNMTFDEAIQFAWLAQEIPVENIRRGAIAPPNQVIFTKSPDGTQDVLKPIPDQIRLLRDEIFGTIAPAASSGDPLALAQSEAARISILNGTLIEGLASVTQSFFNSLGLGVSTVGNAGELPAASRVIDYTGNPHTVRYLVDLMGITEYNIYSRYTPDSAVDIEIILGADWANNNPMP